MSRARDRRPPVPMDPYGQTDPGDENQYPPVIDLMAALKQSLADRASVPQGDGADRAYPNAPDFCCDECGGPLDERECCPECG